MSDDRTGSIAHLIERAYREDLGDRGDITSTATIPAEATARATVSARTSGVVAGATICASCFTHIDPTLEVTDALPDGSVVEAGDTILSVHGRVRSILAAERVALNLLGHLSGIATVTRRYVDAAAGWPVSISDTRKTTPGLRQIEKAAVLAGGGVNHRMGLFDAVLIKDNHIAANGSITAAVAAARAAVGPRVEIEVEVDDLDQLAEALTTRADAVLLDNMGITDLTRAVEMVGGRVRTEASGGVTLDRIADIAATGVDVISVGRLTHSAPSLDVGLDLDHSGT